MKKYIEILGSDGEWKIAELLPHRERPFYKIIIDKVNKDPTAIVDALNNDNTLNSNKV